MNRFFAKVLLAVAVLGLFAGFAVRQYRLRAYQAAILENEAKQMAGAYASPNGAPDGASEDASNDAKNASGDAGLDLELPLETLEYREPPIRLEDWLENYRVDSLSDTGFSEIPPPIVIATSENAECAEDFAVPRVYLAETGEEIPFTRANSHKVITDVVEKIEDGKHIVYWTEKYTVQANDTLSEIVLANGWVPRGMNLYDYLDQCVITDNVSARGRKLSEIDMDEIYVGDKIEWHSPHYEIVSEEDEAFYVTTTEWFSESLHWEHLD